MKGLLLELLGDAWKTVAAGVLAFVLIAIVGQRHDDGYSCAPVEDDGEDVPEDPDRQRDWQIADDMGVM
ncbi:hypothetical protein [Nocardia sp. NPDC049149]|uniref:hypothetical protein n=1 Tax=Nocardia sp. NPDC049149 TaxID=3364315 RepID=UPI003724957A